MNRINEKNEKVKSKIKNQILKNYDIQISIFEIKKCIFCWKGF